MVSQKGLALLKTVSEYMFKGKHFASTMKKVSIVGGGDGKCVAEFTVAEEHLNELGGLHGGFSATVVDVSIVGGGDGKCVAEFTVAEEHLNELGGLHGGFSATVVDIISTLALMTKNDGVRGVSVNINMSYLKGAKEGDVVIVEADTIRSGKNLAFLECSLKHKKDGSLIAKGEHTKFVGMGK